MYSCWYFPFVYNSEFRYSTRQHMDGYQYSGQCAKVTGGMTVEKKKEKRLNTEDRDRGGEWVVKDELMRRVKGAEVRVERAANRETSFRVFFELCGIFAAAGEQQSTKSSSKHHSTSFRL